MQAFPGAEQRGGQELCDGQHTGHTRLHGEHTLPEETALRRSQQRVSELFRAGHFLLQ